MPLVSWEQANATPNLLLTRPEDQPTMPPDVGSPGFVDMASAVFRQFPNTGLTAINEMSRLRGYAEGGEVPESTLSFLNPRPEPVKDYNPFATDELADIDPDLFSNFTRSGSPAETLQIKRRIQQEQRDKETIARSGAAGLALSLATALTDPLTLLSMAIPVAAPATWGSRAERIGASVAAVAATDTAYEIAQHQSQELRTISDSLLNVGAGALVSSALGTWLTRMPRSEFDRLAADLQKGMEPAPASSTVGAARVGYDTTLDEEGIAKGGKWLARTIGRISPLVRTLQSGTKEARVLVERLVDLPFMKQKNLRGVPTEQSVEARVGQQSVLSRLNVVKNFDFAYNKYRERAGKEAISRREFGVKVSQAMRRGDESDISEASEMARHMRKQFDADRETFTALGVLPEDLGVLGARSYFPRVYDHSAILSDRIGFAARLRSWFANNPKRLEEPADVRTARTRMLARESGEVLDAAEDAVKAAEQAKADAALVREFEKRQKEALDVQRDPAEIEDAVQKTIDEILGTMRNAADLGRVSNPRILKSRTLDVPDEILEPYLISDFEDVMNGYIRSVTPNLEMRKTFGSVDLKTEKEEVADAYRVKIANAKDAKEARRLTEEHSRVQEDIDGMLRRVMNQTGPTGRENMGWVRAARIARQYNYIRLLGGQTLSSLSDFGHVISRYGMVRTGKAAAKFLTDVSFNKLTRADNQRLGTAVDWILDSRTGTLADIAEDLSGGRGFAAEAERFGRTSSQVFTRLTLMSTWNSTIKNLTSILEQDAILRGAQNPGKLKAFQRGKIAQMGFSDADLEALAAQFAKHGEDADGLLRARTDLWDNQELAKRFESAIINAGEIMAISKGAGDLPLVMDGELAKTLLQFKSFGMAAVNRLMIPVAQGLAQKDMASANGLAMMVGLGALTYYAKEKAAGREPDLSPATVARESLSWSGALGFLPDVLDPAVSVMPEPLRGLRLSRFADRAPFETFLGPSFGTATDLFQALSNATGPTSETDMSPSLTASDIHKLRKVIPLQNLFYLRRVINALEGETAELLGAQGATQQNFWDRVTAVEPAKAR